MPVLNAKHQFIYGVESQRFSQYSCLKCSYISKDKTTLSRCFLALYIEIEYTVKIISVLKLNARNG